MIDVINEMLSSGMISRAFLVGSLVSMSAALLGIILVLKRYAMIGDGLSHVGFGFTAIALAFSLTTPLIITIPGVLICAIILLKIKNSSKIKSDSAIALLSSSALAIGIAIISRTTGLNLATCDVLFGSMFAMDRSDVYITVGISIIIAMLFVVFYRKLFAVTFDEDFATASGLNSRRYIDLIAVLAGVIIVIGMNMMGALLISSIVVFPALTSMRLFRTFRSVVVSSAIISLISFLIGMYLAYVYTISTGATIVIVNLVFFIIFCIIEKIIE